jgi:hypothetical protein|tara:strand:+ start:1298 stop:1438 length:141 start_codon:yes stop_codon:yes gene_type:complete
MEGLYGFTTAFYYIYIGVVIIGSLMAFFWIPKAIKMLFDIEDTKEE